MPLYHFHLCDDVVIFDYLGHTLDDEQAARTEAQAYLKRSQIKQPGPHNHALRVSVTNEIGKPLFHVGPHFGPPMAGIPIISAAK
jgi:hypothetical protein